MTETSERNSGTTVNREILVYGIATLFTQGAVVVVTPFLTRSLGPAGYGQFELLLVGLNLLAMFVIAGVDTSAMQQYYRHRDETARTDIFSTALMWTMLVGVTLGALVLVAAPPLASWLLGSEKAAGDLRIAAAALPLLAAWRFSLEGLRARRAAWRYLTSVVAAATVQLGMVIWLVVVRDGSVGDAMTAWLISSAIALAFNLAAARGLFRPRIRLDRMRALLSLGAPLLGTGVAAWSMMFVDRLVLSRLVSLSQIGIYALANKVSLVLTLVIYSFNRGWTPQALERHAEEPASAGRYQAWSIVPYLAVVAWVSVGASTLAPFAIEALGGASYSDAADLAPILALGLLLAAPMPVVQITMLGTGRTSLLAWPAMVSAVLNFVAVALLGARYGLVGASIATALAFGFQLATTWFLAQRLEHVAYPWSRLGVLALLSVGAMSAGWLPRSTLGDLGRIAVATAFPLTILLGGVVPLSEMRGLLRGFRHSESGARGPSCAA